MTAQLVTDASVMAIWRPGKPDAPLHHSDRSSRGRTQSGGRNTLMKEVAVKLQKRRLRIVRAGAIVLTGARPSAGRDERRRFWAAIAVGLESGDAALAAGVPPAVGTRWFRDKQGEIPPAMLWTGRPSRFRDVISSFAGAGRKSHSFARRAAQCRRLLVGSGGQRRRSHGRAGAMLPLEAAVLEYRATAAQWHRRASRSSAKPGKLAVNAALRAYVEERLAGIVITT